MASLIEEILQGFSVGSLALCEFQCEAPQQEVRKQHIQIPFGCHQWQQRLRRYCHQQLITTFHLKKESQTFQV